jgi:flavin reductase (DIM6/NTAB) family NADH-FMN oxidoreductase RutF
MKPVNFLQTTELLNEKLGNGGVFLSVGGERPNTMTIGWGFCGIAWGLPVFVAMVRDSRYTYEPLKAAGAFTVSVPVKDPLKAELAFAGSASGRDVDKFSGHGLTAVPALKIAAPIVGECSLHYECVVRYQQRMDGAQLDAKLVSRMYPLSDYHTLFYGEVVAAYEAG